MEKNQNQKPKNSAIYVISVIMLVTVLVIAVISAIGTANRTEDKIGIDTDEAVITGKKTTDKKDTKSTDKTTKDTKDTKDAKDTEDSGTTDTSKTDQSSEAAAPVEFCLPVNGYISKDYSMDMPVFSLTMNDYRTHSGLDIQASVGSAVAAVAEGDLLVLQGEGAHGGDHGGGAGYVAKVLAVRADNDRLRAAGTDAPVAVNRNDGFNHGKALLKPRRGFFRCIRASGSPPR